MADDSNSFFSNPYIRAALARPAPTAGYAPLPSTAMPTLGSSPYGPTHAALAQLLQAALLRNAQQQGNVAGFVQNPNQARLLGGLVGTPYTPPMPEVRRIDQTPNWGSNGLLTNTNWGGPIPLAVTPGSAGSGGFFNGGI